MNKTIFMAMIFTLAGCAGATLTPEGNRAKVSEPELIDLTICRSGGKGIYQTPRKDQGAYRQVVLTDLRNFVGTKGFNVAATSYSLRSAGEHNIIPSGTPIKLEYYHCPQKFWDQLKGYE